MAATRPDRQSTRMRRRYTSEQRTQLLKLVAGDGVTPWSPPSKRWCWRPSTGTCQWGRLRALAWKVSAPLDPSKTCQVLLAAGKHLVSSGRPSLYADSGVENVNGVVASTLFSACLERILAQVEVAFSNSMIEAFWRSLKHQWSFLNTLDSGACSHVGGILGDTRKSPRCPDPQQGSPLTDGRSRDISDLSVIYCVIK